MRKFNRRRRLSSLFIVSRTNSTSSHRGDVGKEEGSRLRRCCMCCFCCCRPRHRDLDEVVAFSDSLSEGDAHGPVDGHESGGGRGDGGGGGGGGGEITANPLVRISQAGDATAL